MSQKFCVSPQQIVLGTVTLSFFYDANDASRCGVTVVASGSQTTLTTYLPRNGAGLLQAVAATVAADKTNLAASLNDANAVHPSV